MFQYSSKERMSLINEEMQRNIGRLTAWFPSGFINKKYYIFQGIKAKNSHGYQIVTIKKIFIGIKYNESMFWNATSFGFANMFIVILTLEFSFVC